MRYSTLESIDGEDNYRAISILIIGATAPTCGQSLGMRDGFIEDFQIWSPSEEIISYPATDGRPGDVGWCLQKFDRTPFLQVRIAFRDILQYKLLFSIRNIIEPRHEISNNVVSAISKASNQPAHMRRLIRAFASRLHIL